MTVRIGSNIASLTAQRRLGEADSALSKTFERLSSGQRINRASDDAAGLAIADDLNAKSRIYTQGIRNGNDGISLLNIADSAISALSSVVVRIRELSEQSANGTYSGKQRDALDAEAQALSKEFTRISQTTSFNGLKVFDGSLGQGLRLQLGVGISESINASIGGNIGTGSFLSAGSHTADSSSSLAVQLGDLNNDGFLDLVTAGRDATHGTVTVRLGLGNGSFGTASSFTADDFRSTALSLGDLNGDGVLDLVTAGYNKTQTGDSGYPSYSPYYEFNGSATVRLGLGDGTFGSASSFTTDDYKSNALSLGDLNGDGVLDLVTAGYSDDGGIHGTATVRLGIGNGSFGSASSFTDNNYFSYALSLGDINGDSILDLVTAGESFSGSVRLGTGDGNFGDLLSFTTEDLFSFSVSLGDLNGDGVLDLVTAGYSDYGGRHGIATVRLGLGNGSFGSASSFTADDSNSRALSLGDLNGDAVLDLVTAGYSSYGGTATVRLGLGNGSFGSASSFTADNNISFALSLGDLNGDGVLDLVTAGSGSGYGTTTVRLAQTEDGLGTMLDFSLKTRADSLQAMGMLDRTLENLAKQRGTIGASQSRIGIALNNLQTATENFKAAESRIRDADIASEAANLVRTQILQQAAASVLSQANQAPQLSLTLFR